MSKADYPPLPDILDEVIEREKAQTLTSLEVRLARELSNLRNKNIILTHQLNRCERQCLCMANEIEELRRIKI